MKLPKQFSPIQPEPSHSTGIVGRIKPSDCPDGDLEVWFPNGTSTTVPGITACCYSYPNCNPCSGHNYDSWIGQHFYEQCGPNNANKCYWKSKCHL